jgi:hypothetical protein
MVFLHPDVKFYPGTESYRPALERFSEILKTGDLGNLPEQKSDLGPIRKVKALKKRGDPAVKKHAIHLHGWDSSKMDELKSELDMVLLRDVLGVDMSEREKYDQEIYEKLW